MKIVYIHQYFKTPEEGGAIRSYHVAKKLVSEGHDVELITAHNEENYKRATIEGFNVHYLPVQYNNNYGFRKRVLSFLRFIKLAFSLIKKIKNIDLVYATSTPLTVGWLALKIKKNLGVPYLFEVRDLWPDAPIEMGVIKNRLLKYLLFRLERKIYNRSEGIIALSPPVKSIIETRTNNRVSLVPNFADLEFFGQRIKGNDLDKFLGLENNIVVVYTGAVGRVNHLEYLIELAIACFNKGFPVKFLIIGEGSSLEKLKNLTEDRNISNVIFIPHQNKFNLRKYLDLADAAYVSFGKPKILETSSPNKLFDALAGGKLIIYNKKGWIRELIEKNKCGFYADPEDPDIASEMFSLFISDPEKLKTFQKNSLKTAKQFSKEKLLTELIQIIDSCSIGFKIKKKHRF